MPGALSDVEGANVRENSAGWRGGHGMRCTCLVQLAVLRQQRTLRSRELIFKGSGCSKER